MYNLIPTDTRLRLHKKIGLTLANRSEYDTAISRLAVEQLNLCKDCVDMLDTSERLQSAWLNLAAGISSITSSSFAQACDYFEAGISFLEEDHWSTQRTLSLELYKMSVLAHFMDGRAKDTQVSERLADVLSNAISFEEGLTARILIMKMFASTGKFIQAINTG